MINMFLLYRYNYFFIRFFTLTSKLLYLLKLFQASFLKKKLNINGKRVNLAIWDTAGQEKFHALGPIYYRMSNGAILVYDITDEDSFQKVSFKIYSHILLRNNYKAKCV